MPKDIGFQESQGSSKFPRLSDRLCVACPRRYDHTREVNSRSILMCLAIATERSRKYGVSRPGVSPRQLPKDPLILSAHPPRITRVNFRQSSSVRSVQWIVTTGLRIILFKYFAVVAEAASLSLSYAGTSREIAGEFPWDRAG